MAFDPFRLLVSFDSELWLLVANRRVVKRTCWRWLRDRTHSGGGGSVQSRPYAGMKRTINMTGVKRWRSSITPERRKVFGAIWAQDPLEMARGSLGLAKQVMPIDIIWSGDSDIHRKWQSFHKTMLKGPGWDGYKQDGNADPGTLHMHSRQQSTPPLEKKEKEAAGPSLPLVQPQHQGWIPAKQRWTTWTETTCVVCVVGGSLTIASRTLPKAPFTGITQIARELFDKKWRRWMDRGSGGGGKGVEKSGEGQLLRPAYRYGGSEAEGGMSG